MQSPTIRVVLIEDHLMVRQGVAAVLAATPDIEVVGEAASGEQGVDLVRRLAPQVVVLDVTLPEMDGIEAARTLRETIPASQVLMLSMHDDAATVNQALRAGAKGYVLKGQSVDVLCEAIRAVAAGRAYVSPEVSHYVLNAWLHKDTAEGQLLTDREREVLTLLAQGFTSAETAEQLGLKTKTVQNHRTNLMEKLDAKTSAALVRHAMRMGLIR